MILMKLGRLSTQNINRVIYIESNLKGVQSFKEKDYAYLFVHIVLISPYYQETN